MNRGLSATHLALLLAGSSCAGYSVRDEDLARLERGELAPGEAVFTCHGMLYDLGFPWDFRLRDEIAAGPSGRLAVVISYPCGPPGVWFNWGSREPGRILAELADAMEELHAATGCPAPLRLAALGFSAGTEAVLEAAFRMRRARLERALLLNGAIVSFSGEPRKLVDSGKIGHVRAVWSPIDLVTLLAPLGAGSLGVHPAGEGIENRMRFIPHLPPLLARGRRAAREYLLGIDPPRPRAGPGHTACADEGHRRKLAELLRRGRSRER